MYHVPNPIKKACIHTETEAEDSPQYRVVDFKWWVNVLLPPACKCSCGLVQHAWQHGRFYCKKKHIFDFYEHGKPLKMQKHFLLYVLMMVPPRTWSLSKLRHSTVATGWVMFARYSTVCEELMALERLSSRTFLFKVQKILPRTHQDWHIISALDPTSTYRFFGKTSHFFLAMPARDNTTSTIILALAQLVYYFIIIILYNCMWSASIWWWLYCWVLLTETMDSICSVS